MTCYLTFLVHPNPHIKSYTDIMFVCNSVTMATAVSVVGGGRHVKGPSAGQSVNLSLSVSQSPEL